MNDDKHYARIISFGSSRFASRVGQLGNGSVRRCRASATGAHRGFRGVHWVQVRSPPDLRRPPHDVELCADPQPRNPCRSVGFIRAGSDFTLRRPETEICADAEIATSAFRLRLRDGQWLPLRSRWRLVGTRCHVGHGGNIQPGYSHMEHGNSDALTTFQSQSG